MCRKLICLASLVFVLGLVWASPAEAADPGLVGWWKFDGDVLDASGNGRNGTVHGNPQFVAGVHGDALEFDGDDYVSIDGYKGVFGDGTNTPAFSVAVWIRKEGPDGGDGEVVGWGSTGTGNRMEFRFNGGNNRLRIESGGGNVQNGTALTTGEWQHAVVTLGENPTYASGVNFYLDGVLDNGGSNDPDPIHPTENFDVVIGQEYNQSSDRWFVGALDDVRIYDRELTVTEVRDIIKLGYVASAYSPTPADGEKIEETWGTLGWTAGPLTVSHNVYFGTSFEDVNASADTAFVGNTATNSQPVGLPGFPAPDGMVFGTTYYWRVDEVNDAHPDSPWRGDVWSFWIPELMAYEPVPPDGGPAEFTDIDLSWSRGLKTIMNAVYFGTDRDHVANGVGAPPYLDTTYDPGPLATGTTYYWRVDTFNGAEWLKGDVWTFTTVPEIPVATDPNLVAWWKLDEGAGTNVLDWSGHANHATRFGTAWTSPKWLDDADNALTFADGGYVAIDNLSYSSTGGREVTACAWVRTSDPGDQYILSFDRNEYYRLQINGEVAADGQVGWQVMTINAGTEQQLDYGSVTRVDDGLWHHVTGVFNNGTSTIFIDGIPEPPAVGGPTFGTGETRFGLMGAGSEATEFNGAQNPATRGLTGDLGDVRIYNRALTQEEILAAMRGDPRMAWDLRPTNGRITEIDDVTSVSWRPGDGAPQHDVYFGADTDAVASADASDATGVYRGRQNSTVYTPPEGFDWGLGYYWRIDEIGADGSIAKGRVRAIKIADYLVVESFEDYNDYSPDEIWNTWIDGFGTTTNGAQSGYAAPDFTVGEHYVETVTVHGGRQALPLFYNNNFVFSEASRTFASASDWTRHGVEELSLWYSGDPCNVSERMYVAVTGGATAVVYNDDPNLVTDTWTEWVIPLQTLADQGVNLKSVTGIALGFGTRGNTTTPGGSGVVFFDDIRLRRAPVIPVVAAPLDAFDPTSVSAAVPAP